MAFFWLMFDAGGGEAGRSGEFADSGAAEAWLSERWPDLRVEGVDAVALREDDVERYRMSLRETGEEA